MRFGLDRMDYEDLHFSAGPGESPQDLQAYIDGQYPTNTAGAVLELRTRGYDVKAPQLEYWIKKGLIASPGGDGRNRQWTAAAIDEVADYCEHEWIFVPGTLARAVYGIDPAQDIRAQRSAEEAHRDVRPGAFVMEIIPSSCGSHAHVRYRRKTAEEERLSAAPAIRVADMIAGLRSSDARARLGAGVCLAHSLGVGLAASGADALDAEHGVGRDLSDLLGRAMAGDVAAVDQLERMTTTDPAKAKPTPRETSAAAQRMGADLGPAEILDRLADAEGDRAELVDALAVSILARRTPEARANAGSLDELRDGLLAGDAAAIDAARRWVVANVLATDAELRS